MSGNTCLSKGYPQSELSSHGRPCRVARSSSDVVKGLLHRGADVGLFVEAQSPHVVKNLGVASKCDVNKHSEDSKRREIWF
ncbi:hypothetical protein TNCV_3538491 [Trichonephila clavipes]|nr:hypothetical protein TNCV_3538491 [Trichonephila clavipes]